MDSESEEDDESDTDAELAQVESSDDCDHEDSND